MMGNEGDGLNERQIQLCDSFVYIPQYGCGTASLNVAVAASIVLHQFAVWAGYTERSRHGFKFDVAERPRRTGTRRGHVPLTAEEAAAVRAARGAGRGEPGLPGVDFSAEGAPGEQLEQAVNG